jgi:hypothetical protein
VNPETGDATPAGTFAGAGVQDFSTPAGWQDALLVLEAAGTPPPA